MPLRLRFTLGLLSFALLGAAATLAVVHQATPVLEQPAQDRAIEAARQLDDKIDHALFTYYNDSQQFASTPAADDPENWANTAANNPLVNAMNADLRKNEFYRLSIYLDMTGSVRAVSTQSPKGKTIPTDFYYGQNFGSAEWFTHARDGKFLEGKSGANGTAITGPIRDANAAKSYGDDGYVLVFSSQVKDKDGKVIGVWANFVGFETIENLLTDQLARFKDESLAHTQLTLLDATGTVIADAAPATVPAPTDLHVHDFGVIGTRNLVTQNYVPAVEGMKGKSGSLVAADDKGGEQLVAFYHGEEVFTAPGLGWTALVRFDNHEIFSALDHATSQILRGLAFAMLGLFLLALIVSKLYTRRIVRYNALLERIASGEAEALPPSTRTDQLGALYATTAKLQTALTDIGRLKKLETDMPLMVSDKVGAQRNALIEKFETTLKSTATEISSAANALRSNAEKVHGATGENKEKSAALSQSITGTTQAIGKASTIVKEALTGFGAITQQLQKSGDTAAKARGQVKELQSNIDGVAKQAAHFAEVAQAITGIAKHANLLAMNVTIEAARAGDVGKGFGLAAGEIKTLASDMAKFSDDITAQLQTMQEKTKTASGAAAFMHDSITALDPAALGKSVEQQRGAVEKAEREINQLNTNNAGLAEASSRIEKNAQEANTSAKQLLTSIDALVGHATKLGEKADAFLKFARDA